MYKMRSSALSIGLLLLQLMCLTGAAGASKLLVMLVDGFRWDYLSHLEAPVINSRLPNFQRMLHQGASVQRIKPVFPTDCLPNIFSLFTGEYPSSHGILFNDLFNDQNGDVFQYDDVSMRATVSRWLHADTIWQKLARLHGKKSHLYHLPTCEANYTNDYNAQFCRPYSLEKPTLNNFNASLLDAYWALNEGRASLAVVYNDLIDREAHKYGPMSPEVTDVLLPALDRILGDLLDLVAAGDDDIHLMFVSDHGLANASKAISFDRLVQFSSVKRLINKGTTLSVWTDNIELERVKHELKEAKAEMTIYDKASMPAQWRPFEQFFPSLFLVANPGHVIISGMNDSSPYRESRNLKSRKGWHGYDPSHYEMQTPLLVFGKRAKAGHRYMPERPVSIVHVYDVMASILGLPHHDNPLSETLLVSSGEFYLSFASVLFMLVVLAVISLVALIVLLSCYFCKCREKILSVPLITSVNSYEKLDFQ